MPNTAAERLAVAVGVVRNAAGDILLAQRMPPKRWAGHWEFPGGKLEAGESSREALDRELEEELGIRVREARRLIEIHHDYPDLPVRLDTWEVTAFDGEPTSREGQPLVWAPLPKLEDWMLFEADRPIVTALRLADEYAFTPDGLDADTLIAAVRHWPPQRLLRLRQTQLDDRAYAALAARLIAAAPNGCRLLLDRDPAMVAELGAWGWHATAARLATLAERPADAGYCLASCADRAGVLRARDLGFDAAVLGPLRATPSHPETEDGSRPVLGMTGFAAAIAACNLPVYAIGGVTPADAGMIRAEGGRGVAGIRAFWPATATPPE